MILRDPGIAGWHLVADPWWDLPVLIRPATSDDLGRMLELNNAAVPAVNELTPDEMRWFLDVARCCLVAEVPSSTVPGPAALLVGLDGPGVGYDSLNYGWFSERFDRFLYVDRVVVDPSAYRTGVGRAFYEAFLATSDGHTHLCAEVNTVPRNERSLAFHDAMGFSDVGEQSDEATGKTVRMYAREL
ncbi:MAG: GNAT family N-acetyltransferase [Acidimicrobiaceae bacterium]|nr:GNAT family N-acetyltransferase [Acidimicrobiaceae bacterium]